MTPSARLQAVLDLLEEIETTPRPADALVSAYFRARRYIGSKDRAYASTTLYDVLRHHARFTWWLEQKTNTQPSPRARLLAYLTLVQEKAPEQIAELFNGSKFSPSRLDKNEEALLHKLKSHTVEHPSMPDEIKVECPDWAVLPLQQRFGKNFIREMQALLEPALLDLRINPLKTSRDDILKELKAMDIKAEACTLSPWGIRIQDRPSLAALPMLKNGLVEIQDEGSQLAALLVDAKPGQRVMDFCAGAGGKTLAIAAQMKNKGRITACDVLGGRLKRSAERFRRAGLHNIETRILKNENDPWLKRHKASFDRVLVDAPCSGTGTWRRNPDSRWRSLGPGLKKLLELQANILKSAARLVKPDGHLIYATCSLLPEENEGQIEKFLTNYSDFQAINCHEILANLPLGKQGISAYLSLTPLQHKTDGFFGAVLKKS
ncbi:MAG: RsmB/NOP family class I SAM-dependent RNA methyltransferase [Alphaproteobacteria bacterium]|nr:RsmB/NOP family class I SAM-dependent RNA methyltransferase [Alphaproteobacteria bacterium]